MSGKKYDSEKPAMHLIPPVALEGEARAMGFGERKYGSYNWLGGMAWSRLVAACMRHVQSWHAGESHDPETGLSHLAHARCCLGMLMGYEAYGLGEDDRFGTRLAAVKCVNDAKQANKEAVEQGGVEQAVVVLKDESL